MKITNSKSYLHFIYRWKLLGSRQATGVSGDSSGDVSTFKPNLELLNLINQLLSEWLSKKEKNTVGKTVTKKMVLPINEKYIKWHA